MRLTVNALQLKTQSSGIGVMIRELFSKFIAITPHDTCIIFSQDSPTSSFVGSHAKIVHAFCRYSQGIRRMFFQSFIMGPKYCQDSVLLTTDSKVPFFLPKSCFVVSLVTDLALYHMGNVYQVSRLLWWRMQYRYLRHRANHFLAVSEFTKQDMISRLKIPPDKIDVVYCAVSKTLKPVNCSEILVALRNKYALPQQYILFVGNFNPRKNLSRLIAAFDKAKSCGIPHHLVIAGEHGWKFDQDKALGQIQHKDDIHFLGFVPDDDLPALYSAASLFTFPTLYEGFGIPVVEAQTCGTPVLTSNRSALPEIGGTAALYVDPESIDDICDGILKIVTDTALAARLVSDGFENAKRFSWEASAYRLNEIIERVTKA